MILITFTKYKVIISIFNNTNIQKKKSLRNIYFGVLNVYKQNINNLSI
jgi:hypothetical protein